MYGLIFFNDGDGTVHDRENGHLQALRGNVSSPGKAHFFFLRFLPPLMPPPPKMAWIQQARGSAHGRSHEAQGRDAGFPWLGAGIGEGVWREGVRVRVRVRQPSLCRLGYAGSGRIGLQRAPSQGMEGGGGGVALLCFAVCCFALRLLPCLLFLCCFCLLCLLFFVFVFFVCVFVRHGFCGILFVFLGF